MKTDNKNVVDRLWIFTIKNDRFRSFVRYKARFVAKSFSQKYLEDVMKRLHLKQEFQVPNFCYLCKSL